MPPRRPQKNKVTPAPVIMDDQALGMAYLYGRPGYLLRRCHQLSVAIFRDECGGLDLTPAQFGILYASHKNPGLDQIAVARLIGLDRSTTANVIDRLAARDLIQRRPHPRDGRRYSLSVTKTGAALLKRAFPPAARAQARLLKVFSAAESVRILSLLKKLMDGHVEEASAAISADGPVRPRAKAKRRIRSAAVQ